MVVDVDLKKTVADDDLPSTLVPTQLTPTPHCQALVTTGATNGDHSTCECTEPVAMDDLDSSLAPGPETSFSDDTPFSNPLDPEDLNEPPAVNTAVEENKYTILGHEIIFPYKAYESQREMMEKIISGVQAGENCLLESPTGTGKTAALLCALLAWQSKFEKDEDERFRQHVENQRRKQNEATLPSPSKKFKGNDSPTKVVKPPGIPVQETVFERKKTPIIYYATRTHSQIDGVVRQLGQTVYKNVRMGILASRKKTCINPKAFKPSKSTIGGDQFVESICQKFRNVYDRKHSDRDYEGSEAEGQNSTEDLAEEPTCKFYRGRLQESTFKKAEEETWDIEDLKIHGRNCSSWGLTISMN